jgi:hypothetical protein
VKEPSQLLLQLLVNQTPIGQADHEMKSSAVLTSENAQCGELKSNSDGKVMVIMYQARILVFIWQ